MDSAPQASCWSSYNHYDGPGSAEHGHCFLLSVILDAGTWNLFAGVRIILVFHETEFASHDLTIKDCHDTRRVKIPRSGCPLLYWDVLAQRRKAIRDGELLGASVGPATNNQPICTVLFEIKASIIGRMTLVLRPQIFSSDPLRVVYDRIYACNDVSHSVATFLESNHSFRHNLDTGLIREYGIPAHSVRILPTHDHRPPFTHLPPHLLRQIIYEAIRTARSDWRSALLSYGTVCKAWVHVLDLFYTFYCGKPYPPMAISVAKSLQYKPENAKLIRRFSPCDYLDTDPDNVEVGDVNHDEYTRSCQALLDILELVTHIREIEISPTDESLLQRQIRALQQLREITRCRIRGCPPSIRPTMPQGRSVTIDDIQSFIVHWPTLSDLDIWYCDAREDMVTADFCMPAEGIAARPLGKLKSLELYECNIRGNQLSKFVPHSQPCLESLYLSLLRGVINSDLLALLLAVSPTLTTLYILYCKIERLNPAEEYAIDTAMSRMVELHTLRLAGDCGTALSIARRYPHSRITSTPLPSISISLAPSPDCQCLRKALETTGWASVTILGDAMTTAGDSLRQELRDIALARGIVLTTN